MNKARVYSMFCIAVAAAAVLLVSCDLFKDRIKVGLVTNITGINDRSFNALAWKGIKAARKELGVMGRYIVTQKDSDFLNNIQRFASLGCDLVVSMGFTQADAAKSAALANPATKFVIVDYGYDQQYDNLLGLLFQTDQAAFLAGYAAAAVTATGKVATFGGTEINPVTLFMDGFVLGVRYYNNQKGKNIIVLGWNPDNQTGLFTGNFDSVEDGKSMAEELIAGGADIIMPVAGLGGQGAAAGAQQQAGVLIVGVDTDWTTFAPDYADIILVSVLKKIDVAVFDAIAKVADGSFAGGSYIGTLANNGVGITQVNWPDPSGAAAGENEIAAIKAGIIDGSIMTRPND